jgi:hypothetical protein
MHSGSRGALVESRLRSLRGGASAMTNDNMDYPFGRTPQGYKNSFVYHVAKALRKDKKLMPRLLTYFNHESNSDHVVQWLLDVPSLEKLKKRLQEDDELLRQLQSFYGPISETPFQEEINNIESIAKDLTHYDPDDSFKNYDKYLRMKKKAQDLERMLKDVLLKKLDDLIMLGHKQAAELEQRKRKRKPAKKVEEKRSELPKTSLEFAVNYLRNEGSKLPFYRPESKNGNVRKTSEAIAWVLSNIIDIELKNRNNMSNKLEDIDMDNPFDQFIADKIAGKALVGPMEKDVIPMLGYFIGPLLKNQLEELHQLALKLKAGTEPMAEVMGKTAENLKRGYSWKMNESEAILSNALRIDFSMLHEMNLPDFNKLKKRQQKINPLSKEELNSLEKLYNELNEYMLYLNGSIYYLQKTVFIRSAVLDDITDKVGMILIDKMEPEQLQTAVETFRKAWNHYFSIYEPPLTKKEDQKERVKKTRDLLNNVKNSSIVSFITSALNYPEIVNLDAINKKYSENPKDSDSIFICLM